MASAEQDAVLSEIDELLLEARRRGEPTLVATLLRSAALGRLSLPSRGQEAHALIDELLTHTRKHGLAAQRAGAHALQSRRLVRAGHEDAALTELARALALADDIAVPPVAGEATEFDHTLAGALVDCWVVLNDLAIYEVSEDVSTMAERALRDSASPHEVTLHMLNRITMMCAWGLRLERVSRRAESRDKFADARELAEAAEAPFAGSLFRRSAEPAVEQSGTIAAAAALTEPAGEHVGRLQRLLPLSSLSASHEKPLVAIALARCLETQTRLEEGIEVLQLTLNETRERSAPAAIRLALERELVRLELAGMSRVPVSLLAYTDVLETELWTMRESRAATVQTRRENERLSAEHGAVAAQAFQDPLTGLPNRRALDDYLHTMATGAQPLSVALVDLDGFKVVNDEQSHAEGDNVLRVIASTVRDALRGDDLVARYGGDEFVVLLPGACPAAAHAAMNRTVAAVAAIPAHLSRGVTLSVGLVSMSAFEQSATALARADRAMYLAKRRGGNQVAVAEATRRARDHSHARGEGAGPRSVPAGGVAEGGVPAGGVTAGGVAEGGATEDGGRPQEEPRAYP